MDTCRTRRGGKVRQDVGEEPQCEVPSWRLLETRPEESGVDNVEK